MLSFAFAVYTYTYTTLIIKNISGGVLVWWSGYQPALTYIKVDLNLSLPFF